MLEIFSPFSYAPDVLVIELPKDSARLKIQAFESEWGTTDEILCYWDGILFGQVTPNDTLRFASCYPSWIVREIILGQVPIPMHLQWQVC